MCHAPPTDQSTSFCFVFLRTFCFANIPKSAGLIIINMMVGIKERRRRRLSATARTRNVKEVGTPPVRSRLIMHSTISVLFQQLCGTESQSPRDQQLEREAKDSPTHLRQPSSTSLPIAAALLLCVPFIRAFIALTAVAFMAEFGDNE